MTFEQFQASGRDVADLGQALGSDFGDRFDGVTAGRIYGDGDLFIERDGDGWYLDLDDCGDPDLYYQSADLAKLEVLLYNYGLYNSYFDEN